jgi:hypothetical protein
MKNIGKKFLLLLFFSGLALYLVGQYGSHPGISVVYYLLRDRAVVTDSLVLRKTMYVGFRINRPLREVRRSAVAATLSYKGTVMARDTTWLFDEAAGNLGLNLPFNIPDGVYTLGIYIIKPAGSILDSLITDYARDDLKPYFNREIQYWDFLAPYAHLECSGYGEITYHFRSPKPIPDINSIGIMARMTSDNDEPGRVEVLLNGRFTGRFDLPAGDPVKSVIEWKSPDSGSRCMPTALLCLACTGDGSALNLKRRKILSFR